MNVLSNQKSVLKHITLSANKIAHLCFRKVVVGTAPQKEQ